MVLKHVLINVVVHGLIKLVLFMIKTSGVRTYEKKTVPQFSGVNNCDLNKPANVQLPPNEATGKWIENPQGEVKFAINCDSYTSSELPTLNVVHLFYHRN